MSNVPIPSMGASRIIAETARCLWTSEELFRTEVSQVGGRRRQLILIAPWTRKTEFAKNCRGRAL